MKRKPTSYEFTSFLYNAGFRWHSTGTIARKDIGKYGEYLEGDFLSDGLKETIKAKFGKWVSFCISQSQYAPERKRPLIVLLSKKAHDSIA
jgi:hypothetical protein